MAATAFAEIDDAGLVRQLAVQERELLRAQFKLSMSQLENTASLRNIRRDIARIRTEIRRRELAEGLDKDALLRAHPVDQRELGTAGGEGSAEGGFLSGVVDKLGDAQ